MPQPHSPDLRERVIEAVAAGASRREAAELDGLGPRVAVLWVQHWDVTGSIVAKPSGGSIPPLEDHGEFLLGLVAEQGVGKS